MKPVDAVLAVTSRCNARCLMCGIWKSDPVADPPPDLFRRLPSSLRNINLTGGEPFLRDDLVEVHAACRSACPRARTVISTNGLLTDRIVAAASAMTRLEPGIGVAVSIDGLARTHDRMRGVKGAFEKAVATVKALKRAGIFNLRLAFTATRANVRCMTEVYELSREMNVQFTCAIEHASAHYFHSDGPAVELPIDELRRQLSTVMQGELRSLSPKRWARAYFMHGLYAFAVGGGRLLPCRAGRDHFFMDAAAEVFACNAAPLKMGNLARQSFDDLWHSALAAESRQQAARCPHGCWMICTARTAIRAAWPRVLTWALKQHLFGVSLARPSRQGGAP